MYDQGPRLTRNDGWAAARLARLDRMLVNLDAARRAYGTDLIYLPWNCPFERPFNVRVLRVPMRYYFHIRRGQVTILDPTGVELTNRSEAAEHGRWLAQREAPKSPFSSTRTIFVEDDFGIVFEFSSGAPWLESGDKAAS